MSKQTKWLILGLVVIGLISITAFVVPLYYYTQTFASTERSTNPSDWGTFGDFLGGTINPVLSLLTLAVTVFIALVIGRIDQRNHEDAIHSPVRPFLTIQSGRFFSADISMIRPAIDSDYYSYDAPTQPAGPYDHNNHSFFLKVNNFGLGIANRVNVTFEMNLQALQNLLNVNQPILHLSTTNITHGELGNEIWIIANGAGFNGRTRVWEKESRSYGIIKVDNEAKVFIPSSIMTAFQFYNLIRRYSPGPIEDFPVFNVTFEYQNIHGRRQREKYRVLLGHIQDYPNYSMFQVLQATIDA